MKKFLSYLFMVILLSGCCYAETAVYNTKTGKIHKPSCPSAKNCTVNCVKIDKKEAQSRGGVPCKKCGG